MSQTTQRSWREKMDKRYRNLIVKNDSLRMKGFETAEEAYAELMTDIASIEDETVRQCAKVAVDNMGSSTDYSSQKFVDGWNAASKNIADKLSSLTPEDRKTK